MSQTKKITLLDKYAKDAFAWRNSALYTYSAARKLFLTEDLILCFPAATLGHHAIEKYLKAALICTGATICNPAEFSVLIKAGKLKKEDCAWGHNLVELGSKLAVRRNDFNLDQILFDEYPLRRSPMTLKDALAMFDPFFTELRYPHEMEKLESVGPTDVIMLNAVISELSPLAECSKLLTPP